MSWVPVLKLLLTPGLWAWHDRVQDPRDAWFGLPSGLSLGLDPSPPQLYVCVWLVPRRRNTYIRHLGIDLLLCARLYARCSIYVTSLNPYL